MFYRLICFLAGLILKSIFRLEVRGQKNIPCRGGLILAANHRSYLDPAVLAVASPRPVFFLAKEGLFIRNALFGRFITALNALPIKSKSGDLKTLRRIISELKAGKVVIVFPEGRRIAEGENVRPMKGVGLLAVKADVPIVPALIEGSAQALPINSNVVRPHKIRVFFGQPIFPQSARDNASGPVTSLGFPRLRREASAERRAPRSEQGRDEVYQTLAENTMQAIAQLKK